MMTDQQPLFECDVETLPLFDQDALEPAEPEPTRLTVGDHIRGLADRRWLTVSGYWEARR